MPEFEYKLIQESLNQLKDAVENAQGNMERLANSSSGEYFRGVYHGHLSVYSSMVDYWTKIITGKGGKLWLC